MNLQTRSGGFVWAVIFYHNPKNNIILLSLNHKSAAESMPRNISVNCFQQNVRDHVRFFAEPVLCRFS